MAEVFVSYKREDRAAVEPLIERLQEASVSVFWDCMIGSGEPWEERIEQEIARAKVVLVCWTPASAKSANVKAEAREAQQSERLVQIILKKTTLPLFLREFQAIDFTRWRGGSDESFRALLQALRAPRVLRSGLFDDTPERLAGEMVATGDAGPGAGLRRQAAALGIVYWQFPWLGLVTAVCLTPALGVASYRLKFEEIQLRDQFAWTYWMGHGEMFNIDFWLFWLVFVLVVGATYALLDRALGMGEAALVALASVPMAFYGVQVFTFFLGWFVGRSLWVVDMPLENAVLWTAAAAASTSLIFVGSWAARRNNVRTKLKQRRREARRAR